MTPRGASSSPALLVEPKSVIFRPDAQALRTLTGQMSQARLTEFDNYNVTTRVLSRSKRSTFVVDDDKTRHSGPCISREEAARVAKMQDDFIRQRDMIVVDGYIGNDPEFRTPTRLIMEKANANIAAMQQLLYYPLDPTGSSSFTPELTVIYTPNLRADGYPDERLIACDLDQRVTRVLHSDYFGESKKGGLRMWNDLVYRRGGLPLHAGLKVIPVGDRQRVFLIVGLSGTGKTTTTFTRQNDSRPVQDDFVAWMPNGRTYATENGCFAKTFGLSVKDEPTIHHAVSCRESYLENVSMNGAGKVDFFDESYTQNGRAVIRMEDIDGALDAREAGRAEVLLILNRNENVIPAVCRLDARHAAAFFMLGETQGTAAGGADEAGKALRIPGTNPFFPMLHAQQGNRFLELMERNPLEVYVMNTGRVGGPATDERSEKVRIGHSSAIVKALAEGTIEWERDPDFGYEVAARVPGIDAKDAGVLNPRKLYHGQGRKEEYAKHVERLHQERRQYLRTWPGLNEEIVNAL
ncbi:MAG: phosphoenolpyruvate carboxykinase [Planctomycetota bacterium]